jgi:predicted Zn-dependent protease with MMP-like domain
MHVSERTFRKLVDEALALIPEEFQPYLKGVAVVIEDWAQDKLLDDLGVPEDETIYGLYSGQPFTEGPTEPGDLPPRITIYWGPLLEDCEDEEELRGEIATTVIHELAHHFGISEERLEELGWG